MASPYANQPKEKWSEITNNLIAKHPLNQDDIKEIVLQSWNEIFVSKIGSFQIGKEIFPSPQIISFLMHELIPRNLEKKYCNSYKIGKSKDEKDIVHKTNNEFSVEIKASSNRNHVFANRSYAQPQKGSEKKRKDGYFITINFEKFLNGKPKPKILKIRFGYLEHSDWIAQKAPTGQQARLSPEAYKYKLKLIYEYKKEDKQQKKLFP